MTQYTNTFEGAPANFTVVSTTNSGGASGTAFISVNGSPRFRSGIGGIPFGTWCVDVVPPNGNYSWYLLWTTPDPGPSLYYQMYFQAVGNSATATPYLLYLSTAGITVVKDYATSVFTVRVAGTPVITFDTLVTSGWYCLELNVVPGASATGHIQARLYAPGAATPTEDKTSANITLATPATAGFGCWRTTADASTVAVYLDNIGFNNTGWFRTAPPVAVGASLQSDWSVAAPVGVELNTLWDVDAVRTGTAATAGLTGASAAGQNAKTGAASLPGTSSTDAAGTKNTATTAENSTTTTATGAGTPARTGAATAAGTGATAGSGIKTTASAATLVALTAAAATGTRHTSGQPTLTVTTAGTATGGKHISGAATGTILAALTGTGGIPAWALFTLAHTATAAGTRTSDGTGVLTATAAAAATGNPPRNLFPLMPSVSVHNPARRADITDVRTAVDVESREGS